MASPVPDDITQKVVRIMVVEDVDFNLDILTNILAERSWQAIAAVSGEAALNILAQDTDFQIILMDLGLPGIDGMETTRRIKKNPATCTIPVIALTAETCIERERFLDAGFNGYAEKNFDPEQLFAAIEKHLFPACGNPREKGPALAPTPEHCDLDFEALLAIYLDENTLCRIAKAFFADTGKELILLDKAMAVGDQKGILACCHSLKGASALFTAKNLGTAVMELEACILQGIQEETGGSAWRRILAAHESLRGTVASRLNLSLQNE